MPDGSVKQAFAEATRRIALAELVPLRPVTDAMRRTRKFSQIVASVREIGMVEPLVVAPDRQSPGRFVVLDGHMRLEVLRELGEAEALCLLATEDEGYTYNNRINRLAIIQEHKMILKAIERGVSEERLAAVLDVNPDHIRRKRRLLDGICDEAAALLEDKHISINSFDALRKMRPERQVEAAELMVAMNKFTISYARTLLAATPEAQLAPGKRRPKPRGVTEEQLALMQRESANLDREFKLIEENYGADHLDLVLARGYLARLIGNERVARYLDRRHKEILMEFVDIAGRQATAA
ncbi:ParB-like nuclease domain-containing protein [Enhydrobacter aerosaccus]|uniref:ParB-like nuclease domain-containing protein n=1 Tax=Enhydrobacter aerosaccus TaxID=225324 RepID=A0A1T4TM00_9HYPH|nr:plasmid partitioning protein RepB C-terminal domain-containing protein [Enhydrobacter aerosaccus]SKA41348.1 ParB-like nuclease domain-containing protein [Enhydrobacter aerosaccus]